MVAWNSGSNAATIGTPGIASLKGLDGREVDRVVRGSGGQKLPQRVHHVVVHHERAAILRAGMHRLQRHRVDRRVAGRDLRDGLAIIGDALQPPFASTVSDGISRI